MNRSQVGLAKEILDKYQHLVLENANEAATRLKVIDKILRDILGWLDDDISPEEHVTEDGNTTYSDYILRTANAAIVVEAKKVGAAFAVSPSSRKVKLSNSFLQSELGSAIIQARDYARKFGIDYAVATNGSVWAVFPAQRHDQVKFNDSVALVFWSLTDILHDSYQEFHDLLSRDAVISGSLESHLLGRVGNQLENRKLGSFFSPNSKTPVSNPMFPILEDEVMLAFSDSIVELDSDSFERCYVATQESIKFDHKVRMYVNKRDSIVSGAVIRPMKDGDAKALVKKIEETKASRRPLAILLLGTVGAGKTTFLHYMRKIRISSLFEKNPGKPYPHWLHVDFLNNPAGSSPTDFIYSSLRDYIGDEPFLSSYDRCTKNAYGGEIKALKAGPLHGLSQNDEEFSKKISELILEEYKQVRPYVDKVIGYATKNAPFFLVIDNVDQLENDEEQSRLFTEALSIARKLSLNLILCLRQSTYLKHRNSPTIDAFDFEVVQIDPPSISSVISKRFSLVKHLAAGKSGEFIAENGAKIQVEDASKIVELLQGSVLGTEIGNRIEVLAAEDVRLALRMTREFLEKGYTNPGRAIEYHRRTGKYILPKHEAFRAIMLGSQPVYKEAFSPIGNPFDSRLSHSQAQLIRLYILSAIVSYASEGDFRFVDGSTISECLRKIGVGDAYTAKALEDLCKFRFIFTSGHGPASLSSSFIPSRLGGHVVRELVANFTFVENTMFDTYISDPKVWQELRDLSHSVDAERDTLKRLRLRVQRVSVFFAYMKTCMSPLVEESRRRGLPAQWCHDVLEERLLDLRRDMTRALHSARNNKRRAKKAGEFRAGRNDYDINEDLDAV